MDSSAYSPGKNFISPIDQGERIVILDSLRGIAILGILLMNIPAFGLPGIGHDPSVIDETGINYKAWYFIELIPHGTQRAIFSMLFGAGIILFVQGAEKKTGGLGPADYFFRRQLWLLVFSLFDVFVLLWLGDILLDYALFGMLLFTFRKLPPKHLLIAAGLCLLLMLARENRDLYKSKAIITKGESVARMDTTTIKLNAAQKEDMAAFVALKEESALEKRKSKMEKNLRKVGKSSYADLYEFRTDSYINELVQYLFFWLWDVFLFMLIGMAFFKMGILTGHASSKLYWGMFLLGFLPGILLAYLRLQPLIQYNFNNFEYIKNITVQFYQLDRFLRSIGLFGAIMLLYKSGVFKWFFALLRPVGQMAFTNYLMQSLLCGLFFYSVGFANYGKLQRIEIYYVVVVVWVIQITYSHLWLKYFRFGPFEWAWRSLTYWKKQPFKK